MKVCSSVCIKIDRDIFVFEILDTSMIFLVHGIWKLSSFGISYVTKAGTALYI